MTRRMMLLTGLLIVAVAVVGTGVGLMLRHSPKIDIPESTPVVSAQALFLMGGRDERLFIYDDGTVIYIQERGLRIMAVWWNPPVRTWRKGTLQAEEMNDLLQSLRSEEFESLSYGYQFPGRPTEPIGLEMGDLSYKLVFNDTGLIKSVWASGFISPDNGLTEPDMPHPLDDVYARLQDIALNKTKEIAREAIRN